MNEIVTTKQEVYSLLEKIPETRSSDMILYYEYCLSHWVREMELYKVFKDSEFRKYKKIAPFETGSRVRRELQNDFVSLRSNEKIEQMKEAREELIQNYYGKGR